MALTGAAASDAQTAEMASGAGFEVSILDFIPIVASGRAIFNAVRTCSSDDEEEEDVDGVADDEGM